MKKQYIEDPVYQYVCPHCGETEYVNYYTIEASESPTVVITTICGELLELSRYSKDVK